jgi:hypothetical protein
MSKVAISGNASGTGVFTIASPNSNTDRTLSLPDNSGTLATAESTLAQFNASGSAPVYAARAWVNFNGTGTVAIRGAGNVSSITDGGVGIYTVNFTTSMPDANYAVVATNKQRGGVTLDTTISVSGTSVTGIEVYSISAGSSLYDGDQLCVAIFR